MSRRCTCTDTRTCGRCERAISDAEDARDYAPIVLDDDALERIQDHYERQLARQWGEP